jgi:Tol biopolymer transport system component
MTRIKDNLLWYLLAGAAIVGCGVLFIFGTGLVVWFRGAAGTTAPASDLFATLSATTPIPQASAQPTATTHVPGDGPSGKIAFTCQLFKVQAGNQICLINADGTGFRRLTTDDTRQHVYGTVSPDGRSVVYSAFRQANTYEIYELELETGELTQLTDGQGVLNAPEISPDGRSIVYTRWTQSSNKHSLWMMNRDGSEPHQFFNPAGAEAWDPTWSPDGSQILFASDMEGSAQLWIVDIDGGQPRQVSQLPDLRGRSDWSPRDEIVTYSGEPWKRELFLMTSEGSNSRRISPPGGNAQGPVFSPDGAWVAFTAYYDHLNDIHGCEIYIMRTDGTDLRRLTENDYCDYQPRWGP